MNKIVRVNKSIESIVRESLKYWMIFWFKKNEKKKYVR